MRTLDERKAEVYRRSEIISVKRIHDMSLKKYDVNKHGKRIESIIKNWDKILKIINEEIPSVSELESVYDIMKLPKSPEEIGISKDILPMTFKASKDIRDKYVLSRLAWDLGIIDEII